MSHSKASKSAREDQTVGDRHPVLTGVEGGLFATVVMTLFREPTARALPPTAEFLALYLDGEPAEYPVAALVLHLLYGTSAGVVFVPFFAMFGNTDEPETIGLLTGAIYGLASSVFGRRIVLAQVLDLELDTDEVAVFHAGHLIYGLTLGVWVGSRSRIGRS